jgi:hypothetical protein
MAILDVVMTILYVVASAVIGGSGLTIIVLACGLICCGDLTEERAAAAAERRAALAALPAPVEVEMMRPVVPVVVAKLGYFPYSAEGREASEKLVCAIFLEVFEHGATCSEVPACQHLFHKDCIDLWMKTKITCPLCRRHIVAGSEGLSAADDMV